MERYSRQIMLPEIGVEGQHKLQRARVLIVGVGGLGSPIALYLAGAGVGCIGLIDDDEVSVSNLQRQVLYTEEEVGTSKALQAQKKLKSLNSSLDIQAYPMRLSPNNAERIIQDYDLVVDGCDNFQTRYLINDICKKLNKVYVYGAIRAFDGQVSVFNFQGGPDYRALFPNEQELEKMPPPPKGVLGVTPGLIGMVEANEVIKIICGYGQVLSGKLWHIDLRTLESHILEF